MAGIQNSQNSCRRTLTIIFMTLELPPQYRIENDIGLPPHQNFRATLVAHLKQSPAPYHDQLAKWCYSKRVIEPDQLLAHIAQEERDQATALLKRDLADGRPGFPPPEAEQVLPRSDMIPNCFGVPYAQAALKEPCASCSLREACRKMTLHVSEQAGLDPASLDPDADRKRMLGRARAAAFRQRKSISVAETGTRNATKSSSFLLS